MVGEVVGSEVGFREGFGVGNATGGKEAGRAVVVDGECVWRGNKHVVGVSQVWLATERRDHLVAKSSGVAAKSRHTWESVFTACDLYCVEIGSVISEQFVQ